ncbi:MAG: hypothetical protein AAFY06_02400 [Pseudomonadota bacterium]
MEEQNLINRRIEEVEAENARLEAQIGKNKAELTELHAAAKVVARLSGAAGPSASEGHAESASPDASAKPEGLPTMPKMIELVLKEKGFPLAPREIADAIRKRWWPDADGQKIGSIVWRMHNRKQLEKVPIQGVSKYQLPKTNEAPDEKLRGETSGDFFSETQAKGREAVPGGGT